MKLRFLVFLSFAFACLAGCNRGGGKVLETNYVAVPQAILRDRVAAVFNKTGVVKNGDQVQVLERDRRFVRVRAADGSEGWVEQRYLATQQVYDGFQKLAQDSTKDPPQGTGVTRNETNLHLNPGRDTDHLYQVAQGAKVTFLSRATVAKSQPNEPPKPQAATQSAADKSPPMEDWWLVRDPQGHVGWVLARMIDLDVPLEIAQYAEGQRIVAFFVLNQVEDKNFQDKTADDEAVNSKDVHGKNVPAKNKVVQGHPQNVPQYLVVMSEPKDGMPFDYNQVRVFTWNTRRHRYETAYRDHKLNGFLPVTISQENFDKEGTLPVFVLRVKDDDGNTREEKYKLNTPIVRRVYTPGEEPTHRAVTKTKKKR
ncbi:MAG TPA: SH3 domain-containing protein [Terriglobales bacterium]